MGDDDDAPYEGLIVTRAPDDGFATVMHGDNYYHYPVGTSVPVHLTPALMAACNRQAAPEVEDTPASLFPLPLADLSAAGGPRRVFAALSRREARQFLLNDAVVTLLAGNYESQLLARAYFYMLRNFPGKYFDVVVKAKHTDDLSGIRRSYRFVYTGNTDHSTWNVLRGSRLVLLVWDAGEGKYRYAEFYPNFMDMMDRAHIETRVMAMGILEYKDHISVICSWCKMTVAKRQRCSLCMYPTYCSVACQKAEWPTHKPLCKRIRKVMESARTENAYIQLDGTIGTMSHDFTCPPREDSIVIGDIAEDAASAANFMPAGASYVAPAARSFSFEINLPPGH